MLIVRPIEGNFQPSLPGPKPFLGAHVIVQCVNAGNYAGPVGTIKSIGAWRADRQPSSVHEANVQIQRNGERNGPSSIAVVLIPKILTTQLTATGRPGPVEARPRFRELTNSINAALNRSISSRVYRDGKWYVQAFTIGGKFDS
jgi:hypothetical protein